MKTIAFASTSVNLPKNKSGLPNAKDKLLYVVYVDDDIILVNKPCWLLSVQGNKYETEDSARQRLEKEYGKIHTVHRLDCATSGLLLFARNLKCEIELHRQFREREVYKKYVALLCGSPLGTKGTIDIPILSDRENLPKQKVDFEKGKKSITKWSKIKSFMLNKASVTLVYLEPVTGRRHQLRVHMQQIGFPIAGDRLYSDSADKFDHLYLHSETIKFKHPQTNEHLAFTSETNFEKIA